MRQLAQRNGYDGNRNNGTRYAQQTSLSFRVQRSFDRKPKGQTLRDVETGNSECMQVRPSRQLAIAVFAATAVSVVAFSSSRRGITATVASLTQGLSLFLSVCLCLSACLPLHLATACLAGPAEQKAEPAL